jgi:hypothetical protein
MSKAVVLYVVLLVLLDTIAISSLRRFLYDFLIGAGNRKTARKIYRQRSLKDRVFLGFIKSFLKSHRSVFDVYHWIYLVELVSLVPQYAILLAVYVLYGVQNNILIFSLIAVKGLLCLVIRFQVDSLMRSRYRNGK